MAAAHALGRAIAKQPPHEKKRMLSMLDAIVATADARQKEWENAGNTGPMSLAEVGRRRGEAIRNLDTVPVQPLRPIQGATKESLLEASAGFPRSLAQQALNARRQEWQQQAKEHPPNALPEYWQKQN